MTIHLLTASPSLPGGALDLGEDVGTVRAGVIVAFQKVRGMPLGDGTLPHHDNVGCTKMGHQHKVSISTVVALVRAPVHKGVINDASIAFTLSLARQGRLRASVS